MQKGSFKMLIRNLRNMETKKLNRFKKWFESKGYEFEDDDFWMEEQILDHKFKDIIKLIEICVSERQESNKPKELHKADVVRSFDAVDVIDELEDKIDREIFGYSGDYREGYEDVLKQGIKFGVEYVNSNI